MDSREFNQWIAYDLIELPNPYRIDAHFGNLISTVKNLMKSPGQRPAGIKDSIPNFDVAPRGVDKIKEAIRKWMRIFKAKRRINNVDSPEKKLRHK